jgi:hypothetical protein
MTIDIGAYIEKEKKEKAIEKEQYEVYQDWQINYAKGIAEVSEATQTLVDFIEATPIFETLNPLYKENLNELVKYNDEFSEEFYELVEEMEEFPDKSGHELESQLDPQDYIDNINNDYFCELDDFINEDEDIALSEENTTAVENTIRQIRNGFDLLLSAHGLA